MELGRRFGQIGPENLDQQDSHIPHDIPPYSLLIDGLGLQESHDFVHNPEPPSDQNILHTVSRSATETILHTADTLKTKADTLFDRHPVLATALVLGGLAGIQIALDKLSQPDSSQSDPLSV